MRLTGLAPMAIEASFQRAEKDERAERDGGELARDSRYIGSRFGMGPWQMDCCKLQECGGNFGN